jgi:hypothetical protein
LKIHNAGLLIKINDFFPYLTPILYKALIAQKKLFVKKVS